jgi:phosphoribosyl 1,2-cyclic phosphate phosphodiesterase
VANDIRSCDAVLFTHHHADHIAGLDDLRRFNWLHCKALECYALPATLHRLRHMFDYAFALDPEYPSAKPHLVARVIDGEFRLFGKRIVPVPLLHGRMPVLGFRIDDFAYCTDCNAIPVESISLLQDLDVLVLDALRIRPHPTHFNLDQAVRCAEQIGAKRTFFTHIAHELMHERTNCRLPPGMELAYDGLRLELGEQQADS